jgi:hypothetical protein
MDGLTKLLRSARVLLLGLALSVALMDDIIASRPEISVLVLTGDAYDEPFRS